MTSLPLRILAVPIFVLVALRCVAPDIVERQLEARLSASGDYRASIANVDLHLWRMRYRVKRLELVKLADGRELPFVSAPATDVQMAWSDLLRGRIRAWVVLDHPTVETVVEKTPPKNAKESKERTDEAKQSAEKGRKPGADGLELATGDDLEQVIAPQGDWRETLRNLPPTTIERLEIRNGTVRYVDQANGVEMPFEQVNLVMTGLVNRPVEGKPLPTHMTLRARTVGQSELALDGDLALLEQYPTFTVSASLLGLDLTKVNDLLRSYAGFDLEKGRLDVYIDANASAGLLHGMAKPLITDLNVIEPKEIKKDGIRQALKEAVIGAAAEVAENQREGRQAAEIPLEGDFTKPKTEPWKVVRSALANAFVQAIKPGHDHADPKHDDHGKRKAKSRDQRT